MPSGRTQVVHDQKTLTLGALAGGTAILVELLGAADQGRKLTKIKAAMEMKGKTAAEGGIIFGFCTGLSATEVAACLLANPTRFKDPDLAEAANRRVFPVWYHNDTGTAMINAIEHYLIVDRKVPSWTIPEEQSLHFFAFAHTSLTSGTIADIIATMVFKWDHD